VKASVSRHGYRFLFQGADASDAYGDFNGGRLDVQQTAGGSVVPGTRYDAMPDHSESCEYGETALPRTGALSENAR